MYCETINWDREHIDTVWKEVVRLETEMVISQGVKETDNSPLLLMTDFHLCL
jgi:hypothetical protein